MNTIYFKCPRISWTFFEHLGVRFRQGIVFVFSRNCVSMQHNCDKIYIEYLMRMSLFANRVNVDYDAFGIANSNKMFFGNELTELNAITYFYVTPFSRVSSGALTGKAANMIGALSIIQAGIWLAFVVFEIAQFTGKTCWKQKIWKSSVDESMTHANFICIFKPIMLSPSIFDGAKEWDGSSLKKIQWTDARQQ